MTDSEQTLLSRAEAAEAAATLLSDQLDSANAAFKRVSSELAVAQVEVASLEARVKKIGEANEHLSNLNSTYLFGTLKPSREALEQQVITLQERMRRSDTDAEIVDSIVIESTETKVTT